MPFVRRKTDRERVPTKRPVPGVGPLPCDVLMLGEGPGGVEDEVGEPFVGPSGQIFDQMLKNNGLIRSEIRIDNVTKVWKGYGSKTTWADVQDWSAKTASDLVTCNPKYIGLIGAWAVRWFFQGEDVHLDWAHGLPFERGGWMVMPMYHPANVFNAPEISPRMVSDFQQFAAMTRGQLSAQEMTDQYPDATYTEITDDTYDLLSMQDMFETAYATGKRKIYVDTEGWYDNPWGISFTFAPGDGFVIHHASRKALKAVFELILLLEWVVVLHNSLHDIEVLASLGLEPGSYPFIDTMVRAYLLGVEEQGLKPLSRRHCGAKQEEYEEVMAGAELEKSMTYLYKVQEWAARWQNKQSCSESTKSSKTSSPGKRTKRGNLQIPAKGGQKSRMTMKYPASRTA